jgi:hypothetical protein
LKDNIFTKRTILLLLTGIGLVLFWRGIWEVSAKFFSEDISLIVGLVILISAFSILWWWEIINFKNQLQKEERKSDHQLCL